MYFLSMDLPSEFKLDNSCSSYNKMKQYREALVQQTSSFSQVDEHYVNAR